MSNPQITPFDEVHEEQTLVEAFESTVRCARAIPFWKEHLPARSIETVDDFTALPLSSRVDLSMADRLGDLIVSPRWIFRSTYPYNQNVCTFPFQFVSGEMDLYKRHERMKAVIDAAGFPDGGESLVLTSPAQYFFASDLCAEIFFEGHHCSIQDVTGMSTEAICTRIEAFEAELVILCTDSPSICPEAFPDSVKGVITFRAAFPELAALDATVIDIYTLTEAPFLGHREITERFYSYDRDHYYIERSPAGMVTITTLLWELMPLIRYQTYDVIGELRDEEGLIGISAFGEW